MYRGAGMRIWTFAVLLIFISVFLIVAKDSDVPNLILIFSALLALLLLAVVILWRKNRALFAEVKIRAKAQKQLRLLNDEFIKKAYTDELSGLGNRRSFFEKAEAKLKLAQLDQSPLAILLIDIDQFKFLNDEYGHAQGDNMIRAFAKVVLNTVRVEDVQGRIGGEEFALMAVNTPLDGARDLAERVRSAVEKIELTHKNKIIKTSISVGVSVCDSGLDSLETLMLRADEALYEAKKLGRNRVIINT